MDGKFGESTFRRGPQKPMSAPSRREESNVCTNDWSGWDASSSASNLMLTGVQGARACRSARVLGAKGCRLAVGWLAGGGLMVLLACCGTTAVRGCAVGALANRAAVSIFARPEVAAFGVELSADRSPVTGLEVQLFMTIGGRLLAERPRFAERGPGGGCPGAKQALSRERFCA